MIINNIKKVTYLYILAIEVTIWPANQCKNVESGYNFLIVLLFIHEQTQ